MNDIITVDQIMALGPCHTEDRVRELLPSGQCTIREIIDAPIPWMDRLWVLVRVIDDDLMWRLWACDCAERALLRERDAGREPDARSWRAVEVARAYAIGDVTDEELATARDAAGAAAWAAGAAARAAARATAGAAARAAWDAALATAWAAAWAALATALAAGDAECEWQRVHLIEMMEAQS
jgi:hypothetical protein